MRLGSFAALFAPLQAAIARMNQEAGYDVGHPWHHQLIANESDGLLDVEYRGEFELWFDDEPIVAVLGDLLGLLASTEVAPALRSFTYRTEAVLAANGTYSIIVDGLLNGDRPFPRLRWTPEFGPVVKVGFDTVFEGSGNGAQAEAA